MMKQFLAKAQKPVDCACFAVAGPGIDGRVKTTNLPWVIDEPCVAQPLNLNVKSVRLINYLEAIAADFSRFALDSARKILRMNDTDAGPVFQPSFVLPKYSSLTPAIDECLASPMAECEAAASEARGLNSSMGYCCRTCLRQLRLSTLFTRTPVPSEFIVQGLTTSSVLALQVPMFGCRPEGPRGWL